MRCMYLLIAAADMVHLDGQRAQNNLPLPALDSAAWSTAVERLWTNMVDKKMSLTGGIGAIKQWEGFGIDYFLPQGTDEGGCYNETCASIAVMMFAERLLQANLSNPDRRYADVMELSLYNNIMTAMDLEGNAFTYDNQLASSAKTPSARSDWFEVACCPPNLARLFGSLGGYLWDYGSDSPSSAFINVHLYTTAKLTFTIPSQPETAHSDTITLTQTSNYPWEGTISFSLSAPPFVSTTLRLRLPAWSKNQYTLSPALSPSPSASPNTPSITSGGYLSLPPSYVASNPNFTLSLSGFTPRYLTPHPYTNQNTVTLARGPIIYCAEDVDNAWEENHFKDVVVSAGGEVKEERRVYERTGEEYVELEVGCWSRGVKVEGEVGEPGREVEELVERGVGGERMLVLVPYYFRANRPGKGQMRVGFQRC